ncbi:MarR family transcriptional regulator [Paenibacillus sp. HB172176]|uniref:MarR family winged helix-turn-helix transcriptional regulator n=1 Tax=Paenibacillus sp. HB172176 TaxID=2493690 RepID=UPI00143C43B5|nr:MarR family transcriptional regulator [Paenibacillus sp. HB172176]
MTQEAVLGKKEKQLTELYEVMMHSIQTMKNVSKSIENPYNLTGGHLFVLMQLGKEQSCKVSDVVGMLGITSGAATGLTDKLVTLGLIERNRPEDDRRVVQLSLTDKGRETVMLIRKQRMEWFKNLFGQLDEERIDQIKDAFQQMRELAEKYD